MKNASKYALGNHAFTYASRVLRIRESYDQLADRYDDAYCSPKDLAENDLIRRWTSPLTPGPVLDVGCGTGLFIDLHNGSVGEYHGFDISPRMLSRAQEKHPAHTFTEHDMDAPWPVPDESQSAVVSLFAMHYTSRPAFVVREMARVLAPGGRFFLTLYSQRWPSRRSYVAGRDGDPLTLSTAETREWLRLERGLFDNVTVRGLSRWVDRVPGPMARLVLNVEVATVLRSDPDRAYFLLVQGERR